MITFDDILPLSLSILEENRDFIAVLDWFVINRDLNGRIRLVAPDNIINDHVKIESLQALSEAFSNSLQNHYNNTKILYEDNIQNVSSGAHMIELEGFTNVFMADRYANESSWSDIAPVTSGVPRVVFFSIKGGVGRSTSLAASAWHLAQRGLKVLVLDLDLESPGLSSALLPKERQPKFGITDWLIEDLVDSGDAIIESMVATSPLSHDGEIYVVPAHGVSAGEYVSKLGRVWMPKMNQEGKKEKWSNRLNRLIDELEQKIAPDIILIDSRSGIDEVASCCVTDLGANLVLLYALEGQQTWNGYRILFEHWLKSGLANKIRDRLQVVAAMVPEIEKIEYLISLREHAYDLFAETLYDEIAPPDEDAVGQTGSDDFSWQVREFIEGWNFDSSDEGAPHSPWAIQWHRSFAGSLTLHGRLATIDDISINAIFGPLIDGIENLLISGENND
ncbi:TPA: AAA family ATPase [Escherichia coli]|nr:P-loop NTPase [Escherichia coli]EEW7516769.1 ParA family protein [Escherichia coli]EEZ7614680.1 ArsA family ATPase [Escherichia coli]EFB4092548.1 ArsA family ATPase [Escherichia coli]EFB9230845.1 ArsA family ATPase [Escherichia coli]EFB9270218.1 ArsA family ATPase [Escherichia coli]